MSILKTIVAACLLSIPALTQAVQAYRNPQVFTQPDGTEVTLSQRGDEFYHFYLTDDGKMVLSDGEGFYFAVPDAQGRPVASKMLATNEAARTAEQTAALATVDRAAMLDQATAIGNANRARRESQRTPQYRAPQAQAASTWPSGIGLFPNNTFPVTGSPKVLIILVQFKDTKFSVTNAKDYFVGLASERGFSKSNATGSALDFFTDASNGKFTPQFDVLGPVTLSNNVSYYGANDASGNDVRPEYMVKEAVQALDATTDFSQYDTDGDGVIDNVYVIYAGLGEAAGGGANTIWPHSWSLTSAGINLKVDGKTVASYACSAEYLTTGLPDGIGTFCHEFSHVMGLPDLYDTNYSQAETLTPNAYSLMDYGSYSNNSRTPPTYSVFERNAMGWVDIEELKSGVARQISMDHMLKTNKGYVIAVPGKTNEFFLLENRQKNSWDAYLPGHGMLVWHIDYNSSIWNSNKPNNSSSHQYIDIVEAGGKANSESSTTMAQYPFPGTKNVTSFTSSTTPALKSWAGSAIDVPLTNIKETVAGLITFDVCGGAPLDPPTCNFTEATVQSDEPVQVTLTLPATAQSGDKIEYIYMYNDQSEIVEGTYSSPITISKSCEFEFWTKRGDLTSEIITINFYIGEKEPQITSYRIVYQNNNSDSNAALTSNDKYQSQCEEGGEIATFNTASNKVYPGTYGLKFSSSSTNGTLVINLTADYQKQCDKVVINAKTWGSDAAKLAVNGSDAQSVSSTADDYTFTLDGTTLKQLKLAATKRLYVKSITFYAKEAEQPETPTAEAPTFNPGSSEVESGTVVTITSATEGASIYYTLDGSDPNSSTTLYTDGITITEEVTIKAVAVKDGYNNSPVATAHYIIKQEGGGDDPELVPSTYVITFDDGGNEGTELSADNYQTWCIDGKEVATLNSATTRVYYGSTGIKFGSGKGAGTLVLDINDDFQQEFTKVTVNAKAYGSDSSTLNVNGVGAKSLTADLADYEFILAPAASSNMQRANKVSQLTIESGGTSAGKSRLHVKSITLHYMYDVTGVEAVDSDIDTTPEYYNLQGLRIDNPTPGNIYIMRRGNKVSKILVK